MHKAIRSAALLFLLAMMSAIAQAQCTITPNQPAVGANQTVTFTSHNCGTPSPGFSVACQGSGCQAGSINATSGVYTGPSVQAQMYSRGCQIGPNNSIYTQPVKTLPVSSFNSQWSGRNNSALAPFHVVSPGTISEYDNLVPDSAPRMLYNFFEGGISGQMFLQPYPPYVETEAGWSQDVHPNSFGGFDNHQFMIDPTTCEYDQIYKWYLDFPTASFSLLGSNTIISFTTHTIRTLQNPIHIWIYNLSGSCPSALKSGPNDGGWQATVIQQPNQHGGSGQLSIPAMFTGSTSSCLVTGIDEGNGFSQNTSSDNAQSGAIYPLNSNSLLPGGTNAAQTPIVGIRPDEFYNNVINNITDPNDGGLVTGWHHAVVTTADNAMIAPVGVWPAQIGNCDVTGGHPCNIVTHITNASSGQVTLQPGCNGSCISALNVCSGNPQFSAGRNNCSSPSGQQFDIVFVPGSCPAGPWAALNGNHYVAIYVDSENFTIPVNTSGFGSYPGSCQIYFDWMSYGTRLRLKSSFNCETITNSNAAVIPYMKAACRSLQTYGLFLGDGTIPSDTWNTDAHASEFDPDFIHDVFTALQSALSCSGPVGSGFSNCLEAVEVSSLNVGGAHDGTTNNQRVTVTYTGSTGTATVDVIQQGTTTGCQDRRMNVIAIPGNTYQTSCWVNGNANTAITYSISPSSGAGTISGTGLFTPPASVTSPIAAVISACSTAVASACDHIQMFSYPIAADGTIRLWLGGKDAGLSGCSGQQTVNFTDNTGKVWYGTWSDAGYQRTWQSSYMNTPGLNFMGLFGTWYANCGGWSGVQNGQLFGTSTSAVNDQLLSLAVPNGSYSVNILGEPGYSTTGTGQNVFDIEGGGDKNTEATVFTSAFDAFSAAGAQYRPYTTTTFTVPVTDGILHLGQRIRTYKTSAGYEGISISAVSAAPGTTTLSITTTSLANGVMGTAYSQSVTAVGGAAPYSWCVVESGGGCDNGSGGALPPGLTIALTGTPSTTISGTPSAAGTFNFVVKVTDSASHTATQPLSITVTNFQITTTSLPSGVLGTPYSASLTASGGTLPYSWSVIIGLLPPGLMLNSSTGLITGTPTACGTFSDVFQVRDSEVPPVSVHKTLPIVISGCGLTILTTTLPNGNQNVPYSATLQGSGGTGMGYTWGIGSGSLPTGLSLNASTGVISGTPTGSPGTSNFTVTLTDSGGNHAPPASLSITIVSGLHIITASLPNGVQNQPYSATVQASGGTVPYTWCVVEASLVCDDGTGGALPAGLAISTVTNTGVISGTPTATGTTNFTVQVRDFNGTTVQQPLSITVVAISQNSITITGNTTITGNVTLDH